MAKIKMFYAISAKELAETVNNLKSSVDIISVQTVALSSRVWADKSDHDSKPDKKEWCCTILYNLITT